MFRKSILALGLAVLVSPAYAGEFEQYKAVENDSGAVVAGEKEASQTRTFASDDFGAVRFDNAGSDREQVFAPKN